MQVSARFGAQYVAPNPIVIFTNVPGKLTVAKIVKTVSDIVGIDENDIRSDRREAKIMLARQIVYFAAIKLTQMTYPQIGRILRRDHTTVMHGKRKIEKLCLSSPQTAEIVSRVFDRLGR